MKRRDVLKTAGGLAFGTALTGCLGGGDDTSGREDVDEDTEYETIDFTDVELHIDEKDHVKIEGYLQYNGLERWVESSEEWLRTYHLYEDDPESVQEPDELDSIRVHEYDDNALLESLPEDEVADGNVFHAEVYGKVAVQYPENPDHPYDEALEEHVIKAHGVRPYENVTGGSDG